MLVTYSALHTYLDDWAIWSSSPGLLSQATRVTNTLKRLGFTINPEKSSLTPSQTVTWLGVEWHSDSGQWNIPLAKQHEITSLEPKPSPLLKTNDKTLLGGISGSYTLSARFTSLSTSLCNHDYKKFTTAPPLIRSRLGCNTSDACFPQKCSTSVDESRHLEDSSSFLQTAACHDPLDRRVNRGMRSSIKLHSHCERPLVTEGEIPAHNPSGDYNVYVQQET